MKGDVLRQVPLFSGLDDADLEVFSATLEEIRLAPGEELFREGSAGEHAYVIQTGELEVLKVSGGREVLLNVCKTGEVIGEMALLEHNPRMATVRAVTESVLLAIGKAQFEELLETSLSALRAVFDTVLARWRATTSMLRHSEKMAQLGTLTAGVAHELNNPAAAVGRGASQLQGVLDSFQRTHVDVVELHLEEERASLVEGLTRRAREHATRPVQLQGLARSDREDELETWLDQHGVEDPWELATAMVALELEASEVQQLGDNFDGDELPAVLRWLEANVTAYRLLAEIEQGSTRISEIVKALKTYSYLDQAPVQEVDIHTGLDDTLLILRNKLQGAIIVTRDYAPDLPKVSAYGSELNQVWTNLIDNAADALHGHGHILIRTFRDGNWVVVEIEDDGPGIPVEIQPRIFEAFFTTKPPGHGTGLGLDTSYNIIVHKHKGDLTVSSEPGRTTFQVRLPCPRAE